MSLQLTANFVEQQNLVVPLAQKSGKPGLAVRVASGGSGVLGTITASGGQASELTWSLVQGPSWLSLLIDPTTLIATLSFSNAQPQGVPYQFFLSVTDGINTAYFPVFLEVREPFSIVASGGGTSFSIASYDASVADLVFEAIGLNGAPDAGVSFIPPTSLPPGMKFVTSDGSAMKLRVAESSSSNIQGGLALFTGSPVSTQVTLRAYKQGTIYDNPDRCATQDFIIESLTAKAATVDLSLSIQWNATLGAFELDSYLDFLGGETQSVNYEWSVTGTATGNITSGGTSSSPSMAWAPATAGDVGFTLKVANASTGAILAQATANPTLNGAPGIPCSNAASWKSTNAVKLSLSAPEARGYVGSTPTISISTPASELNSGETITVTLTVSGGSSLEAAATLTTQTVTLNAAAPSANIALQIPASGYNQKWTVVASAANASSNPTRTGYAQASFLSNGSSPLTISASAGPNLTSNVGQPITPVSLSATNPSAQAVAATFSLAGAPDGLSILNGQIVGNVLKPGTYTFSVVAEATGYARSYSANFTLTASQFSTPLTLTDPVPSVNSLPDNQQFNVAWGYTGTPLTLNMQQGFSVRSVFGTTEAATSEVGSSVITIYGTSFYGDAYTVPCLVLSSSVTGNGPLLDAPTVGTIDENFNLTLNWSPATVDGSYAAYKAWNIWLTQLPNGSPQLQAINGALPTGLEAAGATQDSRIYDTVLSAGDWQVLMQALSANAQLAQNSAGWDHTHEFPTAITAASVTFDNATISLGQTLTLTLDPNYGGADKWQAIFPDGTTSGWLPIAVRTVAKTLNIAGTQPIIIQTLRDYSTSNPAVKLIRQVTKTVYVMNQQYLGNSPTSTLASAVGIGGESGFEVTDASSAAVALAPYEVVVRALVRDTVSNELKLMVATSRTADASSLLGTMAIDVFPIAGRPRVADLVDPALYLSAGMAQAGNPVRIATTVLPNVIVGKPMDDYPLQVAANSGVAPFTWYADNLPFGIKLSKNGTLSGTAQQIGSFTCDFTAVDSNTPPFIAHTTLTLTVETDLAISTTSLPAAVVGTPYQQQIGNGGGLPPFNWSLVSGAPPQGLTLDPDSGLLTGTPVTYNSTTDFLKTYSFTVQVVDAIGAIASAVLTMTLSPAALQFGKLDQTELFAGEEFELTLPIFGGTAPYSLSAFSDDGTIGSGLQIVNPVAIAAVAGVEPPTLVISTPNQTTFPQSYPFAPAIELAATGGTAPYNFSIISGPNTTLPGATISGFMLTGLATADGTYTVDVQVTDARGYTATSTIQIVLQQKNSGTYTIQPVSVNLNSSTNPANFTVTPIAALPDATSGAPYTPGSGTYYGLALYQNGVLHLTQSSANPMNFSIRSGALPGGMVAYSANSFGQATDYSGLILFNVSGGQNPTVNGSFSFEAEFSNIVPVSGAVTQVVARESITVKTTGGTTTPVVIVKNTAAYTVDLTSAKSSPYAWYYPLAAEGGTGPYVFNLMNGTTLPGAVVTTLNGLPALASSSAQVGSFVVNLVATDANGVASAMVTISITVVQSQTNPIHIVSSNLPAYVYANRPLPANTYYVESDLVAAWAATGLPPGVSVTGTTGTRAYLQGTPTVSGSFNATITAASTVYQTTASQALTLKVQAQSAVFLNPPAAATLGVSYRAATNNAIIQVQYTGYQPGDANLPLVASQNGSIGAPSTLNNGTPTTGVSSLTPDGFIMSFDYTCSTFGTDVLTLGAGLQTINVAVNYPQLVATPRTSLATVSEYAATASFAPPATATGGLAPYTMTPTGFSDPRFTAQGGKVVVNVDLLPVGQTTSCSVAVLVTDSAGNTTTVTGIVQVAVEQASYMQASFQNSIWNINVSSGLAFTASLIPNQQQSQPQVGHPPYQYYVDAVTLPPALTGFVQVSPTRRVLAIQCNNTGTSATVADVNTALAASGSFTVPAVAFAAAPALGTYQIQVALRVVDAEGLSTSQTVTVSLVVS